jgi:hypothetical protein
MKYTEDYAKQHGYTYICPSETYNMPTYWIKVHLIDQLFDTIPESEEIAIAWMDSDAVFVRPEFRVEEILQTTGCDFVTSIDPGFKSTMNAGVFFIHRTDVMRVLVKEWMACYNPARWSYNTSSGTWSTTGKWAGPDYEQGSFNERILPRYRSHISLQHERVFANYYLNYDSQTIVCHFMSKTKWKIWPYNIRRNAPELVFWISIIGLTLWYGSHIKRRGM